MTFILHLAAIQCNTLQYNDVIKNNLLNWNTVIIIIIIISNELD